VSLRVLAALAIGAVLYFGHATFIPIALAVLFSLILTAPVEALHRLGLPRAVSAILALVLLGSLLGAAVNLLWTPAQSWWVSAPQTMKTIERRVRPLSQFMGRLEELSHRADQIGDAPAAPAAHAPAQVVVAVPSADSAAPPARAPVAVLILDQTRTVVISIVTVMMLMLFLLAGGPPMLARMSAALASDLHSTHTLAVINAVRAELSGYYGCLALINLGLGLATAAAMALLGMPNPLLWGAVAAVLNFIPYVGSASTLMLLTVVAFVTFNNGAHVAAVAASYLALATLEGQFVQPLVVGRRLELNPIIVFLALWFGGWFWGIAGIVIAVPTLVSLKVVAAKSKHGQTLAAFLSPDERAIRQLAPATGEQRAPAKIRSERIARPSR
jgi:predicted PurR-regulated permease PerM